MEGFHFDNVVLLVSVVLSLDKPESWLFATERLKIVCVCLQSFLLKNGPESVKFLGGRKGSSACRDGNGFLGSRQTCVDI